MIPVTDPGILAQLNGTPAGLTPVTDPALLDQLNSQPGEVSSFARAAANNFPLAPQAIAALSPGAYSENLSDWNAKAAEAKAAHPVAYGAGAVTGALAPLAIPGVGEAMVANPVAVNAGLGAASAISNTDLLKNPSQALDEGVKGGAIAGAFGKLASMLPGPEQLLAKATSPEAVAAKIANPGMEAGDVDAMARALPNTFGKMRQVASNVSDYADSLLSTSPYLEDGAISKDDILNVIKNVRSQFTGRSDEGAQAVKTLEQWTENANNLRNTVSQNGLKEYIRDIDRDIPWDKIRFQPNYQPTLEESALMKLRGTLDDTLKTANPEYAQQMATVSDALSSAKEFSKKFGLERHEGQIVPGDTTAGRLDRALVGSKAETQRILGKANELTGDDLETPLLLRQFKGPTPENPAGVPSKVGAGMVGAALGHGLGVEGMGLGAVLGHRALHEPMSIAGRRGSEWIIDNVMSNPALRAYLPTFSQAAERGEQAVVADHYTLMQKDPQYNLAFSQQMQNAGAQ